MRKREGGEHYHGDYTKSGSDVIGEALIGDAKFEIRRGMALTLRQIEVASSVTLDAAYAGLVKQEGLHKDGGERRAPLTYELQRRWYDATNGPGGEPKRVAARREALYARLREEPVGPQKKEAPAAAPKERQSGPSIAHFVRKGLLEGQPTEDIIRTVKLAFPDAKCDAKHVAFYRHQLRKKGELPEQQKKEPANG